MPPEEFLLRLVHEAALRTTAKQLRHCAGYQRTIADLFSYVARFNTWRAKVAQHIERYES